MSFDRPLEALDVQEKKMRSGRQNGYFFSTVAQEKGHAFARLSSDGDEVLLLFWPLKRECECA